MSLFLNNCRYENCKKLFQNLPDLITHIELEHLDFSEQKLEQLEKDKPEYLPMSYVLRFSKPNDPLPQPVNLSAASEIRVNKHICPNNNNIKTLMIPFKLSKYVADPKDNNKSLINPYKLSKFSELYENKPGSIKELGLDAEELPPELKAFVNQNHKLYTYDDNDKKPYLCNLPGCHKRYKNVNGIKYHYKNYHKFRSTPTFNKKSVLKSKPSTVIAPIFAPQMSPKRYTNNSSASLLLPRAIGSSSMMPTVRPKFEDIPELVDHSEYLYKFAGNGVSSPDFHCQSNKTNICSSFTGSSFTGTLSSTSVLYKDEDIPISRNCFSADF